jgi:hypothetical protein
MKIGVEEELIVVDPETLWINPGAFRLANTLVYTDKKYVRKCSVELPLNSGSFSHILSHLSSGFCIIEVKTDPYEDIDSLKNEMVFHRKHLAEAAKENHLFVLPCGLHPGHRKGDFRDNCAAFHVHVDHAKNRFDRLQQFIPFLITISANSPFLDGQIQAFSNRMKISPHVDMVSSMDSLERNSDLLRNLSLDTVEVKVFDTQVTIDESIGLVSIVKAICEDERFSQNFSLKDTNSSREDAINKGSNVIESFIDSGLLLVLKEYNEYASRKLLMKTGAEWQTDIFKEMGLSSVVSSLAKSFEYDERRIQECTIELYNNNPSYCNLWYLCSYFPFFILEKYKKYVQDIKLTGGIASLTSDS